MFILLHYTHISVADICQPEYILPAADSAPFYPEIIKPVFIPEFFDVRKPLLNPSVAEIFKPVDTCPRGCRHFSVSYHIRKVADV
jgi:hypothetical protein